MPGCLGSLNCLVPDIRALYRKVHSFSKIHQICLMSSYVPGARQIRQIRRGVIFLMGCRQTLF